MSDAQTSGVDPQAIATFLVHICALARVSQLYGPEHPRTKVHWEDYERTRAALSAHPGLGTSLRIVCDEDRFYLDNLPLSPKASEVALLRSQIRRRGTAGFKLSLELTRIEELAPILSMLASPRSEAENETTPGFAWLSREELSRLESAARTERRVRRHVLLGLEDLRIDEAVYLNAMKSLADFMDECHDAETGDMGKVIQASDHLVGQFSRTPQAILPLTTIPYYDNFTYYHSLNVALLTLSAARLVTNSEEELRRVGNAALLHDLGKIDIPLEILHKPGRLTEAEADIVKRHPVTGARRLAEHPDVDMLAVAVAFGHHIKDNGEGYPKVSSSFRIGSVTALLEVADMFEALTANRPYKKALTAAQAFEVLYAMPNMASFRPYMDLLVRAIGFNPVGSRVRTAEGEIAIVVGHAGNDPRRPIIRPLKQDAVNNEVSLGPERIADSLGDTRRMGDTSVVALDPEDDYTLESV